MKLYYSPFSCSLAAHIACLEAGLEVSLHRIELGTKRIEGHGNLREINPTGQVPTLVTDDGRVLTENCAVLLYIADQVPSARLAPAPSSFERYELLQWMSFIASELHKKCLWPIFSPVVPDAVKAHARELAPASLQVVEQQLATRETLLGGGFSVADAHLWWTLTLFPHGQVSLAPYPNLRAFHARHLARPAVAAALSFDSEQYKRAFEPSAQVA